MNAKFLFGLMGGAMLLAFVLRSEVSEETGAAQENPAEQAPIMQAVASDSVMTDADTRPPANDDIILDRQSDGHFYTTARTDGADIRFLVDTGASAIALTGEDASAIGLSWNEEELQKVGRGVSGDVFGKPVLLDRVQIGDLIVSNVQAAIIPEGLDVSLLGQSFLSKVGTVNITGDKMTLH
jgi:clan AA aspartic protease (TIGR02281 family)